jgi:hypothetical protein
MHEQLKTQDRLSEAFLGSQSLTAYHFFFLEGPGEKIHEFFVITSFPQTLEAVFEGEQP